MQKQAPSIGRILVAVGFALSCFGLLLFLWVAFGGPIPLAAKDYRVTAYFPEGLGARARVRRPHRRRLGRQGEDRSSWRRPTCASTARTLTAAELEIEPEFAPINSDARAIVRQKTLSGRGLRRADAGHRARPDREPAVALGAAANVSDAEAEAAEPVPEGGSLGIGAVEEATQFDEILNAFDEETREPRAGWVAAGARPRCAAAALDLSDGLGNLAPFLEDAAEITATGARRAPGGPRPDPRHRRGARRALRRRPRRSRGAVAGAEQTFGGLADANEPLAEIAPDPADVRARGRPDPRAPRRPSGRSARPVVAKLLPVASDVPPTLRSVAPARARPARASSRARAADRRRRDRPARARRTLAGLRPGASTRSIRRSPSSTRSIRFLSAYRERRRRRGSRTRSSASPGPCPQSPASPRRATRCGSCSYTQPGDALDPPDPPQHQPRQRLRAPERLPRGPRRALLPELRLQEHRLHPAARTPTTRSGAGDGAPEVGFEFAPCIRADDFPDQFGGARRHRAAGPMNDTGGRNRISWQ